MWEGYERHGTGRVGNLLPGSGSTGGLETFVETSEIGKLTAVVTQGTHEPGIFEKKYISKSIFSPLTFDFDIPF